MAEITSPDFPGERLIRCCNPKLGEERARKREALLAATENKLAPTIARVLADAAKTGVAVGKKINKYNIAKHFDVAITDTTLTLTRKQAQIDDEAAPDGICVIRTPSPPT